jgi:hypothetical protein
VARLLGVATNTFVPPMMFKNSGNMGLPLAVLAFGEAALPAAVVLFFVENLLHYSLGTWMLDHRARLWNLWRVPVIAAALAGLAVSLLQFPLLATAVARRQDAGRRFDPAAAVFAWRAARRQPPCRLEAEHRRGDHHAACRGAWWRCRRTTCWAWAGAMRRC